jgi:hypothetical protein
MSDQVSDTAGMPLITERLVLEMPRPAKASRVLRYLESNRVRFEDTSPTGSPLTLDSALKLHRIMANYMPSNHRSAAVLRRCGFSVEGLARDYLRIHGEWHDHVLTSRINPQWRPHD